MTAKATLKSSGHNKREVLRRYLGLYAMPTLHFAGDVLNATSDIIKKGPTVKDINKFWEDNIKEKFTAGLKGKDKDKRKEEEKEKDRKDEQEKYNENQENMGKTLKSIDENQAKTSQTMEAILEVLKKNGGKAP